jgi:hypothetical protein
MMIIVGRERRGRSNRALVAVPSMHFVKHGDEHRRNILEDVLRFGAIENGGVLPELVRHLVNNELPAIGQRFISFFEERAFLFDRENAERDSGKDVIALRDIAPFEFFGQVRGVAINHMDARIVGELPLQIA